MALRAFKIWYSDSTAVGYSYADWVKLPDDDIQAVVIYEKQTDQNGLPRRIYSSGVDEYALAEDGTYTSSYDPELKGHVKLGKYTDWDNLMRIEAESFADTGEWLNG